jgi:hypothetical protein
MDSTASVHQILYKSWKCVTKTLAMTKQAFQEESMSRTRKVQTRLEQKKKARQVRVKSRACSFLWRQGDASWQAEQSIAHTTVTFFRRLRENVRRLRPEIRRQRNWLLHHYNAPSHTSFFTTEFVTQNKTTVVLQPPYFSLFPRLKIKLNGRHFDITEVIEAESQAVLNILTEHKLQNEL